MDSPNDGRITLMPQLHPRYDGDLGERVAKVEYAVENLVTNVEKMSTSVDEIKQAVGGIGKTDFKTIIGVICTVIPVLFAMWLMFVSPIQINIENITKDVVRIESNHKEAYSELRRAFDLYRTVPSDLIRLEGEIKETTRRLTEIDRKIAGSEERERFMSEEIKRNTRDNRYDRDNRERDSGRSAK